MIYLLEDNAGQLAWRDGDDYYPVSGVGLAMQDAIDLTGAREGEWERYGSFTGERVAAFQDTSSGMYMMWCKGSDGRLVAGAAARAYLGVPEWVE